MQNVTILGITLQDRSTEESLGSAVRFLRNSSPNVIAYIDYPILRSAITNNRVRDFLGSAAIIEWTEPYLMEAVGITDPGRLTEVGSRRFLIEELTAIASGGKPVALVGDSDQSVANLEKRLGSVRNDLNIVHRQILSTGENGNPEDDINSINQCAPAMIISCMDYVSLAEWFRYSSSMINAGIWLALPEGMSLMPGQNKGVMTRICDFFKGRLLKLRLDRYKEV